MKLRRHLIYICMWAAPFVASAGDTLSLGLYECRRMALAQSERLRQQDNAVVQSEMDRRVAFSKYLPEMSGTAMVMDMSESESMGMTISMRGMYLAGLMVEQPLYTGGRLRAANALAKIGGEVAEQKQRLTREEVIEQTDRAYWNYVAVLEKVRMMESYLIYMQALHQQVQTAVDAEMATGNDLLRIDAKESELSYNLQKCRTGAELCRLVLCDAVGADLAQSILPTEQSLSCEAPESMSEDLSDRPELVMLEKGLEAKQQQVKMTRGEFLPALGLGAGYCYLGNLRMKGVTEYEGMQVPYSYNYHDGTWYGALSLSVPITGWYEGKQRIRKARLDVDNARLDLERNRRQMSIQVRQAMLNVTDGYLHIETARRGQAQAEENLRVMRQRYDAGLSTLTDLLDAQSLWQQAESNLIEAQTQYRIYQTEYLKAVGRL